jgi:hypothetical protein
VTPKQALLAFYVALFNALFAVVGLAVVYQLHPHGVLAVGVWAYVVACVGGVAVNIGRLVSAAGHKQNE